MSTWKESDVPRALAHWWGKTTKPLAEKTQHFVSRVLHWCYSNSLNRVSVKFIMDSTSWVNQTNPYKKNTQTLVLHIQFPEKMKHYPTSSHPFFLYIDYLLFNSIPLPPFCQKTSFIARPASALATPLLTAFPLDPHWKAWGWKRMVKRYSDDCCLWMLQGLGNRQILCVNIVYIVGGFNLFPFHAVGRSVSLAPCIVNSFQRAKSGPMLCPDTFCACSTVPTWSPNSGSRSLRVPSTHEGSIWLIMLSIMAAFNLLG